MVKEDGNDDVIINNTLYAKKTTSKNNNINNVPLSIMQCFFIYMIKMLI